MPGHFAAHVDHLLPVLKAKCHAMAEALNENFGATAAFTPPAGGIYIWVILPETVDTRQLAAVAAAEGVAINPGPGWAVQSEANRHRMRLCFGHPSVETIRAGVARLADICHREFGVPVRSGNVERG